MSQQSEERLTESASADPNATPGARILHLRSRQYDLQKAIQQRAQESVEREAALDQEERRPKPLKWLVVTVLAAIPIVLTLVAVDSFLRVFHKYLDTTVEATQQQQAESSAEMPAQSNQPGVVMLQPFTVAEQAAPSGPPDPAADPKN